MSLHVWFIKYEMRSSFRRNINSYLDYQISFIFKRKTLHWHSVDKKVVWPTYEYIDIQNIFVRLDRLYLLKQKKGCSSKNKKRIQTMYTQTQTGIWMLFSNKQQGPSDCWSNSLLRIFMKRSVNTRLQLAELLDTCNYCSVDIEWIHLLRYSLL